MKDLKKFENFIESNLWKILNEEYAGDLDTISNCRLIYKGTEIDSKTGEPYHLFSTTVLEYQEELVHNPEFDIEFINGKYRDTALEFIDQGEYVPVLITLGIDNNLKIVEALIDE